MFGRAKENAVPQVSMPKKRGRSVLGPTLTFRGGEISSDEDLTIEGTVEGRIAHQDHQLTIGESGRVKADVRARIIIVEGTIEGDLHGDEAVHIARTARVIGNVSAPRVSIEDGASFEGSLKTTRTETVTATPRAGSAEVFDDLELRAQRRVPGGRSETG